MTPPSEDQLRARFQALRNAERGATPEFRTFMDRAEQSAAEHQPEPLRQWPLGWAALSLAAAAAIVVASGLGIRAARNRAAIEPLSTWTSPTAVLLSMPSLDLLQPPDLFTSVLDPLTSMTVQPKGG